MSGSQAGLLVLLVLLLAAAAVVALAVVRHAPRSRVAELVGRGAFRAALAAGIGRPEDRLPAAIAARHLLELERAAELLDLQLAADPDDGEALVERGLVEAYRRRWDTAEEFLARALAARADLAESITLHRAWLELGRGRPQAARRRFEEVEAAIESKLLSDLESEPLFAEWYLQAAALWRAGGRRERAAWAWQLGVAAAPESRLSELAGGDNPDRHRPGSRAPGSEVH